MTGLIFPEELQPPAQMWLEDRVDQNNGHRRRLFRSTERASAARTLPAAVARSPADVAHRREPTAPGRAGAVVAGLGVTTAGDAAGRLRDRRARRLAAEAAS